MIFSMDPLTFVTLILAIATIALAIVAYLDNRETKRQVDILSKQTSILRSQIDPIPSIQSFNFEKNKLNINIVNIGNGPASSLAIQTSFVPARRKFYGDSKGKIPLLKTEIEEALIKNKQVTIRYEPDEKKLFEKGVEVTPIRLAYILFNKQNKTLILLPNETSSYTIDLGFGLRNVNGSSGSWPPYDALVEILKENNITCFIVGFRLLCKNIVLDPVFDLNIAAFVVDLTRHSNIEEAYDENTTPAMTIDLEELALMGIPIESDLYLSFRHSDEF